MNNATGVGDFCSGRNGSYYSQDDTAVDLVEFNDARAKKMYRSTRCDHGNFVLLPMVRTCATTPPVRPRRGTVIIVCIRVDTKVEQKHYKEQGSIVKRKPSTGGEKYTRK